MKKVSPVIVVGLVLTVLSLGLLTEPEFVLTVSNFGYDELLKRVAGPARSGRVAIIDIDEASLDQSRCGQWPWPRFILANLLDHLWNTGVSVVAFDVIFPENDRTSPGIWGKMIEDHFGKVVPLDLILNKDRDFDLLFAERLAQGKSILGCMLNIPDQLSEGPEEWVDPYYRGRAIAQSTNAYSYMYAAIDMQGSLPILRQVAETAFINAIPDADNIVRRSPLVIATAGKHERIYPSLALEAIRLSENAPNFRILEDRKSKGLAGIVVGRFTCPTDRTGRIVVNFRETVERAGSNVRSSFPVFSAADVLDGKVTAADLKGKIVFVGTSAAGLRDLKATPLTSEFPGVEVHATIVDNILSGDMLRIPEWMTGFQAVVVLLAGIFLSVATEKSRSWLSFLLAAALVVVTISSSFLVLRRHNVVFTPSWVILMVLVMYPVLTTIKYWQEELQKKRVRHMFGTMVSETVLKYLENNPGSFSLSGYRTEATMFFSDIAGFATITESLQPEQLPELLNSYLSPMTKIIMNRNGYVDKYEGDLIMAEWGVPSPMKDHAVQACLSAIEQQESIDELRDDLKQRFGHEIHVRMGINTGTVTAGNMGSDRRFQFTVLGDAVNLAARFEPANKDYRSSIIIGEETYQAARDAIEARMLDLIVVKGISRPARIYELLGRKGALSENTLKIIGLYERALTLHWKRDWDGALDCLNQVLGMDKDDGPSLNLMNRIEQYKLNPPGPKWVGEYVRESKD